MLAGVSCAKSGSGCGLSLTGNNYRRKSSEETFRRYLVRTPETPHENIARKYPECGHGIIPKKVDAVSEREQEAGALSEEMDLHGES